MEKKSQPDSSAAAVKKPTRIAAEDRLISSSAVPAAVRLPTLAALPLRYEEARSPRVFGTAKVLVLCPASIGGLRANTGLPSSEPGIQQHCRASQQPGTRQSKADEKLDLFHQSILVDGNEKCIIKNATFSAAAGAGRRERLNQFAHSAQPQRLSTGERLAVINADRLAPVGRLVTQPV